MIQPKIQATAAPCGGTEARHDALVIDIETQLRGRLARALVRAAARRKVKPVELLARIVETVLNENLIDAVLDDGEWL